MLFRHADERRQKKLGSFGKSIVQSVLAERFLQGVTMQQEHSSKQDISGAVARIQAGVMAFGMAVLGGLGMFVVTAWLLIKGGPNVGSHLQLLGQYFVGYTVSWTGCFVGMFYGALVGGIAGWFIGIIYNRRISSNSILTIKVCRFFKK